MLTSRISCHKRSIFGEFCCTTLLRKKSTAEAHRILVETIDNHVLSGTTCRDWIRRFENNNFDVEDKESSGAPKKFKLAESLGVDHMTVSKRMQTLGMIEKQVNLMPHELKPRDVERRIQLL